MSEVEETPDVFWAGTQTTLGWVVGVVPAG